VCVYVNTHMHIPMHICHRYVSQEINHRRSSNDNEPVINVFGVTHSSM